MHSPSEQILQTPYYAAYSYGPHTVGIVLEDDTTDGDPYRKIKDTLDERDEHGNINQFVVADAETRRHWLRRLGLIAAKQMLKEDLRRQGDRLRGPIDQAAIADFPKDYELYLHKTQRAYDPRKDVYLFGSRNVTVFRSPAEFAEHLIWLMSGSPLKSNGKPDCDCVYCDPSRTQAEISYALGVRHKDPHAPTTARGKGEKAQAAGRGRGRRKRSPSPASIPAKDYTKLNL
ncbi:uncharacterized protein C8Q71DRAFT_265888 [Rhodofomes roseus]|uniref:Cryptic loci regulator 2 N-terminal domain-containing protein n=1 Tax=Rhodofomes roseus TaxID=34475 RepID=A0ABQ8K5G9_9APHY|nr:uncharacterized protein C8Q71DRAFT_265888 [Rhodofomes roseus]KAH9832198.1 hypothetical protein C8Q71DRAFT_265888 [Rhodofomes roseus]